MVQGTTLTSFNLQNFPAIEDYSRSILLCPSLSAQCELVYGDRVIADSLYIGESYSRIARPRIFIYSSELTDEVFANRSLSQGQPGARLQTIQGRAIRCMKSLQRSFRSPLAYYPFLWTRLRRLFIFHRKDQIPDCNCHMKNNSDRARGSPDVEYLLHLERVACTPISRQS
jgi:hypothetical protein